MFITSPPPAGSKIDQLVDGGKTKLSWKPKSSVLRFAPAGFLIFWLTGWSYGLSQTLKQLLTAPFNLHTLLFLGGGTFAALMVLKLIWQTIRPIVPESITLDFASLQYDSGVAPLNMAAPQLQQAEEGINPLFARRKKLSLTRDQHPTFVLEQIATRQRLRVDVGAERVEIGRSLTEPEREWLYGVLKQWQKG